jgi:RNA polymerase sigma-70 factor (ECF subfamily)
MSQADTGLLARDFRPTGVRTSMAVETSQPIDLGRYRQALLDHIRSIVRNPTEAEDVLQEVLVKAHQSIGLLRAEGALATWLFRIATHLGIDHLRKHSRQPEVAQDVDPKDLASEDDGAPGLQRMLEQQEMSACVRRFLLNLPSVYRTVLLLHDLDGLTAPEIASSLGITVENAKVRLHRARTALRAALEAGCSFSCDERGVLVCEPKRG